MSKVATGTLRTVWAVGAGNTAKGKGKAIASRSLLDALQQRPGPASGRCFSASASCSRPTLSAPTTSTGSPVSTTPAASVSSGPLPTTTIDSTAEALRLLRSQPSHYVLASITGRTYLLAPRDVVTVPRLRDVRLGDVLELESVHEVGSRDFTLRAQDPLTARNRGATALLRRSVNGGEQSALAAAVARLGLSSSFAATSEVGGAPRMSDSWAARLAPAGLAHTGATLPQSTVRVRCVVTEHTKGLMERIEKRKRRKGYRKTIEHKQTYTRLRVESIELGNAAV